MTSVLAYETAFIPARVARGMALLDTYGPSDWRERINIETLDVGSRERCVLGQICGDYHHAPFHLRLFFRRVRNGFYGPHIGYRETMKYYDALTSAWVEALRPGVEESEPMPLAA